MRNLALRTIPFALLAAACSLGGQDFSVLQSSQPRDTSPNAPDADMQQLATDGAAFAADLYGRVATDDSANVFFSPYSVSVALAMTYNGANGETAQQIASALHFTLPVDRLDSAFDAVDLGLATRKNVTGVDGNPVKAFELNVADSLWADKTLAIAQPFVDKLGVSFGASLMLTDFLHAPEPARAAINGWVSDRTNAKIAELIPVGDIDESTRFVLVNAIYFDAPWASPFETSATHTESFTHVDGTTSQATVMSQTLAASYGQGDGWQAVELPYVGEETSMVVVVPDSGKLASVEQGLSGDSIQSVFAGLAGGNSVSLTLPKFQIKGATISLAKQLKAMGMVDAFDPTKADFSNMTSSESLSISDVVHQAFVDVGETGTEAAAATAVISAGSVAEPTKPITLDVNRPFLFFIRDIPTNTVLFMGRVVNP